MGDRLIDEGFLVGVEVLCAVENAEKEGEPLNRGECSENEMLIWQLSRQIIY
jgi:hypothetical protein